MHSHRLGYLVFGNAFPWVSQFMGMHSVMLGYPCICECMMFFLEQSAIGRHSLTYLRSHVGSNAEHGAPQKSP